MLTMIKMNAVYIGVIVLSLAFLTVITLLATGIIRVKKHDKVINPDTKPPKKHKLPPFGHKYTYINPKPFNVGLIKGEPYKTANLCDDKVLYPIQGLGVEYGFKMPKYCPCMEFIQSP